MAKKGNGVSVSSDPEERHLQRREYVVRTLIDVMQSVSGMLRNGQDLANDGHLGDDAASDIMSGCGALLNSALGQVKTLQVKVDNLYEMRPEGEFLGGDLRVKILPSKWLLDEALGRARPSQAQAVAAKSA